MSPLFARRRWVLETRLAQEECVSRLKSKVRVMWETKWDPERPLYGTVSASGFAVQITPKWWRRSMNPFFIRGVLVPSAAGTTIRTKYGVLTTYRLFLMGIASFFLFVGWRLIQLSQPLPLELFVFFGVPLSVILLIIYRVIRGMTRYAEFDRPLILNAVAETLEARITEGPETIS